MSNQTIQLIILAAIALVLLVQTIFLLVMLAVVLKQLRSLREKIEDLRAATLPLIHDAREVFARIAPKIEAAAGDLSAVAHGLRTQAAEVQSSTTEILERARRQASRLDAMTSAALDAIDRASNFMTGAVAKPMRQLSALLASIRAAVESLRTEPSPKPQPNHLPRGD
jgi:vacuolar-type H+-ATPase subunit H